MEILLMLIFILIISPLIWLSYRRCIHSFIINAVVPQQNTDIQTYTDTIIDI